MSGGLPRVLWPTQEPVARIMRLLAGAPLAISAALFTLSFLSPEHGPGRWLFEGEDDPAVLGAPALALWILGTVTLGIAWLTGRAERKAWWSRPGTPEPPHSSPASSSAETGQV